MTFASTSMYPKKSLLRDWQWGVDKWSVAALAGLVICGLLLSLAASPAAADRHDIAEPFYYFYRQVIFAVLAVGSIFVISFFSAENARRLAMLALVCSLIVMVVVLFDGHTAKGAARWIRIGPFGLQPSEFAKPGLVVTFAWLFAKGKQTGLPGSVIAIMLYLITVALLMAQPDFGQTTLVTACFASVFFMSGMSWISIVGLGGFAVVGAFGAYTFMPHVASRIDRFLNPSSGDTYQVDMAMDAIQRGGFFGVGPGEGRFKNLIPDAHTDFVFSVAAEEYGILFCLFILLLFSTILVRSYMRALRLTDPVSQLSAAGLATLLGMQAFINIGVNLQILPPKGMTLPFISYGGSSLLASGLTMGLLLAFTRERPGNME